MDTLEKITERFAAATNIQPLLTRLRTGRVILETLSLVFRVAAIVAGLIVFVGWYRAWPRIVELKFLGGLALLVWQLALPYAAFLALKVLYLRAREIRDFPDSDYVVAPVIAMLARTGGEMALVFLAVMSVPAMLSTWFGAASAPPLAFLASVENAFFAGLLALLACWALGFAALILAQLAAEWTLAIFAIANDANILRRHFAKPPDESAGS